jgi:ParB family transcriptional regulator, chromosome partitioning protein
MSKGKPVLGRGLASLIPRPVVSPPPTPPARRDDGVSDEIVASVDLDKIQANPYQPRADFDQVALDELRQSILEKGIIQPITVRRMAGGYQLISGERRVRAAREAGLRQVPAYIIRVRSNEEMLELALIENLQREHLNPIEIAISYKRLLDECKYTQEQVSEKIGKDRTTVTNFLRLLKLPPEIQSSVRKNELSFGHARALVAIEDRVTQMHIFRKVVDKEISVREVERLARERGRKRRGHPAAPSKNTAESSSLESVEERLRQLLATKVQVKPLRDGRGEIILEYYSPDDLERILEIVLSSS